MRFGSKVQDGIHSLLFKDLVQLCFIGYVAPNEFMPRVDRYFFDISKISRIRQQVKIYDLNVLACAENIPDETGADEAGSARHENFHCRLRIDAEFWIAALGISSEFPSNWLATRIFVRSRESKVPASDNQPSTN